MKLIGQRIGVCRKLFLQALFCVQLFVKNLMDATPITDLYVSDDSSGLFTNAFTLDPRTFGVAVTKRF